MPAAATASGGTNNVGGGIDNNGTSTLTNSIVSDNSASTSTDINSGSYTDNGGKVVGSSTANLASLGSYGGPTQTMIPQPGSAAICAGTLTPSGVTLPTTDQRGYSRTTTYSGSACIDAGAVQSNYALSFTTQPSSVHFSSQMSPAPVVTLTENEDTATFISSGTIAVSNVAHNISGTGSVSISSGLATFSNLSFPQPNVSDTLTASLALNANTGLPTITATSSSFAVGYAPSITSANGGTLTQGLSGSFTVTTSGVPVPSIGYTGTLPGGVTLVGNDNGTATLSGTPASSGTYRITFQAASVFGSATQSFTLTVASNPNATPPAGAITIAPDQYLVGVQALNSCGSAIPFTVTNKNSWAVNIGYALGGVSTSQFSVASNTCGSLAAGASCTISVEFCPTSIGSKSALLELTGDHEGQYSTATAFLYNYETNQDQAIRRVPPVLSALSIPTTLDAGQSYTITWSLLGYNDSDLSSVALFDCTGITAGFCGESFGSNFAYSGSLNPVSTESGSWTYNSADSTQFDYSYTFTTPSTSTGIVLRFYQKGAEDAAAGMSSVSLLVPGNITPSGTNYYDSDGRRLEHDVQ